MNQIAPQGINQQVAARGTSHNHSNLIEHEPLNGGDNLGVDRRQFRVYFEAWAIGIGPTKDENGGSICKRKRMNIDGTVKIRVIDEPAFSSGAEFTEIVAGYAA